MAYLLDSDWVIHALAGRSRALSVLERLSSRHISVSVITLAEVYQQAFESTNPDAYLATYRGFIAPFRIIPVTEPIAVRFAEIRALLTRRGEVISDFDMLITSPAFLILRSTNQTRAAIPDCLLPLSPSFFIAEPFQRKGHQGFLSCKGKDELPRNPIHGKTA
jgi:tRNA(fMet)-specific endonuclease VapC